MADTRRAFKQYCPPLMPALLDQAVEDFERGDIVGSLMAWGRNQAPAVVDAWWSTQLIDTSQLREVICAAWSAPEFPARYVGRRRWLQWFEATGFVSEPHGLRAPSEPIEVWRSQVGRVYGLAWTTSRERADWFQHRNELFGFSPRLLHLHVAPPEVLALINGRNEDEVLVHPRAARKR